MLGFSDVVDRLSPSAHSQIRTVTSDTSNTVRILALICGTQYRCRHNMSPGAIDFRRMNLRPFTPRRALPLLALVLPAFGAALGAGCSKPLLSPEESRSQYDRYDAVRSQYASQYIEDEFGRRRPNLKGRLMPKE